MFDRVLTTMWFKMGRKWNSYIAYSMTSKRDPSSIKVFSYSIAPVKAGSYNSKTKWIMN